MKYLMLIVLVCVTTIAQAEPAVMVGGWSKHMVTDGDYNSNHKIVAIEYKNILIGRFTNSYYRESYIAAYAIHRQWSDVKGSLYVGAVRGYRGCYSDNKLSTTLCPVFIPSLSYTKYSIQPAVLVLGEAVVVAVKYQF